jgi:hypothetical protein
LIDPAAPPPAHQTITAEGGQLLHFIREQPQINADYAPILGRTVISFLNLTLGQRFSQVLNCGIADLGANQAKITEPCQLHDMYEAGIGDIRAAQVQLLEIGEAAQTGHASIRHFAVSKIEFAKLTLSAKLLQTPIRKVETQVGTPKDVCTACVGPKRGNLQPLKPAQRPDVLNGAVGRNADAGHVDEKVNP